ncbi:MAG: hypothetical protein LBD06_00695, partial [Candidatus Accumulibacter sp.]|nr:hypothetical protein [Accumulibacter sp.]
MKPQNHTLPARLLALSLLALPVAAPGAVTDLSDTPLSGASSMAIKPNILFILDDSYSMDWTYLPDWAGEIIYNPGTSSEKKWRPSSYQSYNANFNGVAYNPAVRYLPPSYFDAQDHLDAVAYPSQTSAATTGWTQVPLDGYGIQSKARVDLVGNAFYYRTVPGEYCKDRTLRDCGNQNGPSVDFPVPATLRWCQTEGDAKKANSDEPACQAVFIDDSGAKGGGSLTYMYPRMPAPRTTRISFSGSGQTTVGSVKVNGGEILSGSATASTPSALASEIAKKIHACATAKAGNCALAGYDAEVLSTSPYGLHMVVIYAPGDTSAQPSVTIDSG